MQIPSLSIALVLDKSGLIPVIRVADTTAHLVPAGVTGIVSILQPDGLSYNGNFTTPDIFFDNGALLIAQKELRLADDGNFQKGLYQLSYTARSAGYDDTTITQSFSIDYARPSGVVAPGIDVFTPMLKVNDVTNYTTPNFSLQSVVRSWTSVAQPGNKVGGNVTQFDLNIGGNYYDSIYTVEMAAVITYRLSAAANVSVVDKLTVEVIMSAEIPISLNALFVKINAYKSAIVSGDCKCKKTTAERKIAWSFAYALFMDLIHRGTCGDKTGLLDIYDELQATISDCDTTDVYTPTNAIIPTYNFGDFCGIGAVSLPLLITSQPQSLSVAVGAAAPFSVAASGLGPLTYQWRKNSVNISGATNASYNIPSASNGDQAGYDCQVRDALNNLVTSITANLTVTAAVVQFTAQWAWVSFDPYAGLQASDGLFYQGSAVFNDGAAVVADFRPAPVLQYLVVKVPAGQPLKTVYSNGPFNTGNIPDFVWRPAFIAAGFRYYVTVQPLTLDALFTTTLS